MGNKGSLLLPQKMRVPATRLSASQEALKHEARLKREAHEKDPYGMLEGTKEQDLSQLLDELSGAITSKSDDSATPPWMINKTGVPRRAPPEDPRTRYGVIEHDIQGVLSYRPANFDHDEGSEAAILSKVAAQFKLKEVHVRNLYRFTALAQAETLATTGGSGSIGMAVVQRPFKADRELFSAQGQKNATHRAPPRGAPGREDIR